MKKILIALAVVILLLVLMPIGGKVYYALVVNPEVTAELRNSPESERAKKVMLLSLPDGKELPVNYLRKGNLVFVGADGAWWKTLQADGKVTLYIQGQGYEGSAKVILDQPDYVKRIFSELRPTVPKWLPDFLNGKLIEIQIDSVDTE